MKTETIHHVISFSKPSLTIYNLLINPESHSELTGSEVEMSQEINGSFSVFDGYCTGYNIELIPGKRIKQAWNFKEENWPTNHFSICEFNFKDTEDGCELDFIQSEVPAQHVNVLSDGWYEYYWNAIHEFLEM